MEIFVEHSPADDHLVYRPKPPYDRLTTYVTIPDGSDEFVVIKCGDESISVKWVELFRILSFAANWSKSKGMQTKWRMLLGLYVAAIVCIAVCLIISVIVGLH